jgi:hypothetical protein
LAADTAALVATLADMTKQSILAERSIDLRFWHTKIQILHADTIVAAIGEFRAIPLGRLASSVLAFLVNRAEQVVGAGSVVFVRGVLADLVDTIIDGAAIVVIAVLGCEAREAVRICFIRQRIAVVVFSIAASDASGGALLAGKRCQGVETTGRAFIAIVLGAVILIVTISHLTAANIFQAGILDGAESSVVTRSVDLHDFADSAVRVAHSLLAHGIQQVAIHGFAGTDSILAGIPCAAGFAIVAGQTIRKIDVSTNILHTKILGAGIGIIAVLLGVAFVCFSVAVVIQTIFQYFPI